MALSRRSVLKGAGIGAAAIAAGVGWQFRATTPPDGPQDIPLAPGAGPSLLIVYGSMMGSTGGQALWMALSAQSQGYRVQLSQAETATAPDAFDAVILGSAIRASAWLDPVVAWAGAHAASIAARPHGLFQCSMTCAGMLRGNGGMPLTAGQCRELRRDCDNLFRAAPALTESEVAFFPGRLEFDRLTPLLRLGYPIVSGSLMSGDHRDRPGAESWAAQHLA